MMSNERLHERYEFMSARYRVRVHAPSFLSRARDWGVHLHHRRLAGDVRGVCALLSKMREMRMRATHWERVA